MRILARQHAFGGAALFEPPHHDDAHAPRRPSGGGGGDGCVGTCTRHHAIDWNFVGRPRPRPNKWRVRPTPAAPAAAEEWSVGGGGGGGGAAHGAGAVDDWQELSFASTDDGAPYYHERWVRHPGGGGAATLALRARGGTGAGAAAAAEGGPPRDALVVVVGDHFGYVVSRPIGHAALAALGGSLAAAVDEAIARGERAVAEQAISLEAGHGTISGGWVIDAALQPWRVGRTLPCVFGGGGGESASSLGALEEALRSGGRVGRVQLGGQAFEVVPPA